MDGGSGRGRSPKQRTSWWRRNPATAAAIVVVGALVVAAVLIVVLGQPPGSSTGPRFVQGDDSGLPPWVLVGAVVLGGALCAVVLFSVVANFRERRVRFSKLPPEEQQRRKEAAQLLRGLGEARPSDHLAPTGSPPTEPADGTESSPADPGVSP